MNDTQEAFHTSMIDTYHKAAKIGYRPTRFLQMVNEKGGVEAAKIMLSHPTITNGFTTLWEKGRLDLSVEALVLKPEFASLFSDDERVQARRRLAEVNYDAPWDDVVNTDIREAQQSQSRADRFTWHPEDIVIVPASETNQPASQHPYSPDALERLITIFKRRYPSFDDQRYLDDERTYKRMAAARMRELIGQEQLRGLIGQAQFDEAKAAIIRACQGTFKINEQRRQPNNLLNQWDMQPLQDAPAEQLARRLDALLYGDGPFDQRFDAWVELLAQKKSGVWPSATYFLMLHDPDAYMFIKPTPFQIFLKTALGENDWPTRPDAASYQRFLDLSRMLLADLAPLGARDLMDVQSFIWSVRPYAEQYAWVFQSSPNHYDLPGALAELDEIDWTVRQHADKMHIGDTVYLWESGENAGVLARATVLTEPADMPLNEHETRFLYDLNDSKDVERRVRLHIDDALPQRLSRDDLREDAQLRGMAILKNAQDTNFRLSEAEAARLAELFDADDNGDEVPDLMSDALDTTDVMFDADDDSDEVQDDNLTTGAQDGLSGEEQIRIALQAMIEHGGAATVPQIYVAVEARMAGRRLSQQGKDSLRSFINREAVQRGYVFPYNGSNPVWRITPEGRAWIEGSASAAASAWPPAPPDGPTFVIIHSKDEGEQVYGETYVFSNYAGGAHKQLSTALAAFEQGGPPVYIIIYRPQPYYAFTAWARVAAARNEPGKQLNEIRQIVALDQHEFPTALNLKSNAAALIQEISWLNKGLGVAFRGVSIRRIELQDFQTIIDTAQKGGDPVPSDETISETRLPTAWNRLRDFAAFVHVLEQRPYAAEELFERANATGTPPESADAEELADDLRRVRLVAARDDGGYERHGYVAGEQAALLRLMALALLVPIEGATDAFVLPARDILPRMRAASIPQPLDTFAPELADDSQLLLAWYAEAGLVTADDVNWQPAADALQPLRGDDPASAQLNLFLATLQQEIDHSLPNDLEPADGPLRPVADLDQRLRAIGQSLLLDDMIVRRVYRSLMAGRHVVLSGPPGTGKTELAKLLPTVLWAEDAQTFNRLTTDLNAPPVVQQTEQRRGYAPIVVTATEDWGVRDVIGGIGPQLDSSNGLSYTIQYGALTRAVLHHYDGMHNGRIPAARPLVLTRRDYRDEQNARYRGAWLVIDEFTRAPVDAAFGSLLTTLSGGTTASLAVPGASGELIDIPLPPDFRIIGTLNSFDRHFLNQISEALKRRFDFIDVPPPAPELAQYEQGIAARQALARLHASGLGDIERTDDKPPTYRWNADAGTITAAPVTDADGRQRYELRVTHPEADSATHSFWNLFTAIRVFRQLGTAQAVALYTNLFAGAFVAGMAWPDALDAALADTLADQLQVLNRDEQRVIEAYVMHAGAAAGATFATAFNALLNTLSGGRKESVLHSLHETARARKLQFDRQSPTVAQIIALFQANDTLALPADGVFLARLRGLIGERGL